jgi:hypothetical protein
MQLQPFSILLYVCKLPSAPSNGIHTSIKLHLGLRFQVQNSHLVHITLVVSDYVAQIHGKFNDLIAIHLFTRHCIYYNGTEDDAEE